MKRMSLNRLLPLVLCFLVLLLGNCSGGKKPDMVSKYAYDIILRNGIIIDGTGHPRYQADVGIRDGFIVAIGDLSEAEAKKEYDVSGLFVTPGFISLHSHAVLDALPTAKNMLTQGVTTEIMHADGGGSTDISKKLQTLEKVNPAVNVGVYIGFNSVWENIVGERDRHPTDQEFTEMQDLIKSGMKAGAWGVSSGLQYVPAFYASTNEVIRVVKAAAPWRTVYRSHIRNEYNTVLKAVKEDLTIGENAGLVPVVTHIKVVGKANWGKSKQMLAIMKAARTNGTYTVGDVYPYLAAQTSLTVLVPAQALDGGFKALLKRIKKPEVRSKIKKIVASRITGKYGDASKVLIPDMGKNLAKIAQKMGVDPAEAILRLFEQKKHNIGAIMFYGSEKDFDRFLTSPMIAVSCDCGSTTSASTHPRFYGSWPKVLGRYVREDSLLSWEEAVRKMTGLPATTLGMNRRGFIAPGMIADITVFDPTTIIDKATYQDPKQYAKGVKFVFVDGEAALAKGKVTGLQNGQILRKGRHNPTRPMSSGMKLQLSGSGEIASQTSDNINLSFNIQQDSSGHISGTFNLTDSSSGIDATLEASGMLQATDMWGRSWAAFTGMIRTNKQNSLQPLLLIVEGDSAQAKVIVHIGKDYKITGMLNTKVSGNFVF